MSSRQRIDEAALRLLATHGYAGFGMQALADDVGLHKSTLFHHYKSKAEICAEVVRRVMLDLDDLAGAHIVDTPPKLEQFISLTSALCEYFAAEPNAAKLLLRVVLAPSGSALAIEEAAHPFYELMNKLVSWCRRAREAGAIRWIRIRQTLFDLMGVIVFQPAIAPQMTFLSGKTPFSPEETAKRKVEVAAFVRGALAPDGANTSS